MKLSLGLFALIVMLTLTAVMSGCQPDRHSPEGILKNVDARQAMAIANDWKLTKKEIRSFVTNREVVFELPNDRVKRIPLPADQMVVAIAPYVNSTHQ
jgi:hypothetical protein